MRYERNKIITLNQRDSLNLIFIHLFLLGYCCENLSNIKHWHMFKNMARGKKSFSLTFYLSKMYHIAISDRCSDFFKSVYCLCLQSGARYTMLYLSLCVTEEQCNEKGAFEVCGTWLNQFPFKTIYLEQGSYTS